MSTFPDVTFTGILAYKKNHVYISSVSDELAEQNVDHTAIFRWLDGKWAHKSVDVAVRGMCVQEGVKLSLLNMGINGKIVEFTFPGENVEHVDLSENGPSDLLHLRCMAKIGNHIFVAGMARRVYRRDGVNRWTVIDNGVFVPKEAREKSVGFNSIDGLAENSICAVGYGGEIWNFDSKKWKQEESPTNLTLNCVKCAPNGDVYMCGMAGIIIHGSVGRWESIRHDVTDKDFWGIAFFQDHMYVSNYDGVFKIDDDNLSLVNMNLSKPISTAYLDANFNVLWSVGQKDLVYTTDGMNWVEVAKP